MAFSEPGLLRTGLLRFSEPRVVLSSQASRLLRTGLLRTELLLLRTEVLLRPSPNRAFFEPRGPSSPSSNRGLSCPVRLLGFSEPGFSEPGFSFSEPRSFSVLLRTGPSPNPFSPSPNRPFSVLPSPAFSEPRVVLGLLRTEGCLVQSCPSGSSGDKTDIGRSTRKSRHLLSARNVL